MSLPPELAHLDQQYNDLVDAAEAGHISQQQAIDTLAALTVADAAGALWALNADGDFVRAPFAGAPAEVADPATFATSASGFGQPFGTDPHQGAPFTPDAPFAADARFGQDAPAAGPGAGSFGVSGPLGGPAPVPVSFPGGPAFPPPAATAPAGGAPSWAGAPDPLDAPPAGFSPDPQPWHTAPAEPLPAPVKKAKEKKTRNTRSLTETERPAIVGAVLDKGREIIAANKVLAVIVAVGAALLLALSLQSGQAPAGTKIPTGAAPAPAAAAPAPAANLPKDAPAPVVPSRAQAVAVISALSSGRQDLVAATTVTPQSAPAVLHAAALWAGAHQIGLAVTPGPAVAQGQGAVQTWTLTQAHRAVGTVKVAWALAGSQWKIAVLPTF